MTDRLDFETRLEERLRARADLASRPFEAAAIARQVVAGQGRRARLGWLEWPTTRLAFRGLAVALLLAMALLGAAIGIGALLRERPPLPTSVVSNGWIAISANPWNVGGGENGDIYIVSEGNPPRRVIGADGDEVAQACPRFSPDGGRLVYGEGRATGTVTTFRGGWTVGDRAIVIVGVSEHGDPWAPLARVAIPAGQGPVVCPEWSPTGQHVAFRLGAALWIADGVSGATRVLPDVSAFGREDNDLEWSRDGSMIAVAEPGQIRIIHVDGGAPTVIAVEGGPPRSLGWTADDRRIVYVSVVPVDGYGSGVHVVAIDGANDTLLTPVANEPGFHFTFDEASVSPDGTRVAYRHGINQCTTDGCGSRPAPEPIVIADLDGSSRIDVPVPDDLVSSPRWSPDGKRLLLSSIVGISSIGLEPGSPVVVYANGTLGRGLNLEWSASEVTWQPVPR